LTIGRLAHRTIVDIATVVSEQLRAAVGQSAGVLTVVEDTIAGTVERLRALEEIPDEVFATVIGTHALANPEPSGRRIVLAVASE
jgi:hypothetical protein